MNILYPTDYRLGPGDAVIIDIWCLSENHQEHRFAR